MRYFIDLAYNGKNYNGWQIQPNEPSIQETLNDALCRIVDKTIYVIGCGRTDTGVHARYFTAHFDTEKLFDTEKICYKLNCFLPKDIVIFKIYRVRPEAHSRFDAIARTYEYHITYEKTPFETELSYYYTFRKLNVAAMNEAANVLFEYSDFTSFSKLHTDAKTNICDIKYARWEQHNDKLVFTITADRFLRNMVRAIVGTLIDVGRGKLSLSDFKHIIEQRDRGKAGVSVPAHALFLTKIEYPHTIFMNV